MSLLEMLSVVFYYSIFDVISIGKGLSNFVLIIFNVNYSQTPSFSFSNIPCHVLEIIVPPSLLYNPFYYFLPLFSLFFIRIRQFSIIIIQNLLFSYLLAFLYQFFKVFFCKQQSFLYTLYRDISIFVYVLVIIL